VEGEGFEPSKAEPSDLQSDPFDRSGIPPAEPRIICDFRVFVNDNTRKEQLTEQQNPVQQKSPARQARLLKFWWVVSDSNTRPTD
jgi:hypothetical protein